MTQEQIESTPVPAVQNDAPVQQSQAIQSFDPERDIKNAKMAAKSLMEVINKSKLLKLNGKKYLYFEHWQTIGQFFNTTVGIEWVKPVLQEGKTIGYEAKSIVYKNGTVIGGAEAVCMYEEKNWAGKPEFQLRSMAQTRAMSKGLRSIFGSIAVLAGAESTPAEEMSGVSQNHTNQPPVKPQAQAKAAPTQAEVIPNCGVHNKPMSSSRYGGYYCAEKVNGTWCGQKVK